MVVSMRTGSCLSPVSLAEEDLHASSFTESDASRAIGPVSVALPVSAAKEKSSTGGRSNR